MKQLLLAAMAVSALGLSACSTPMGSALPASMTTEMTPEERGAYVQMAAASDLYEIQSSQIALQKAQASEVREFAQMLIQHHTEMGQQLLAAAQATGMPPANPDLMPMHEDMIGQLQQASASEFDELYISQQISAHEMALALHRNYAQNGDTPALRRIAATAAPVIEQHLEGARALD